MRRRWKAVKEFIQTEARYIEALVDVVKYYLSPLREMALEGIKTEKKKKQEKEGNT